MVLLNLATRKILSQCKNSVILNNTFRSNSRSSQLKVTVCGAAGGVGQPLSLMLKQSPYIDQLALYDVHETGGLAAELNHIDTQCHVTAYNQSSSAQAFAGSSVVVVVAKAHTLPIPDMTKVFTTHAPIVKEVVQNAAKYCPKALIAIASTPIEGMVPLATEILKLKGVYNPKAVFGINTLNVVRSNSFAAETLGIEPECVVVPVVGGSFGAGIIPVLSQTKPCGEFTDEEIEVLTAAIQNAECNLVKVKGNLGGQLANAFSIARFVVSLVKALKGHEGIVEYAMVASAAHPLLKYVTVPISLGPNGIKKDLGLPNMSSYEHCMFEAAVPILIDYNQRARAFLGIKDAKICDPCDSNPRAPLCPPDWCEKQGKEMN